MPKIFRTAPLVVCAAMVFVSPVAQAALLTDPLVFQPGAVLATLESVQPGNTAAARAAISGVDGVGLGVQALNGGLAVGTSGAAWALGSNGQWTSLRSFIGVNGGADPDAGVYASLVFDFGGMRVQQVGAVLNFNPDFSYGAASPLPLYLAAYDLRGELLDSHEVSITTPGGVDTGLFVGIALDHPLIARFEVSGPYAVVDDLVFSSPVPETHALWLALAGLGLLVLTRDRPR